MYPFQYLRATDEAGAVASAKAPDTRYLAGGTSIIDLMRQGVMRPKRLVDINALPLSKIESRADGIRVGAMARNSDLAYHPWVRARYPVLSEALLSGASPQLRNMATVGGNLLQRTRCPYFRDGTWACNKRDPGKGCAALDGGYSRAHAVLGRSERCIATHPSDMCVALLALDAVVITRLPNGTTRSIPIGSFHTLPGETPAVENVLEQGELVTHIDLPDVAFAARSHYVKVRDRASYAFALASAAVALDVDHGRVRGARVALGGVATKPWRSFAAERELIGAAPGPEAFARAGSVAMEGAVATKDSAFKIELGRRVVTRALAELMGRA